MMALQNFNLRRIPYFKAWGIFAFMGDVTIWIASESPLWFLGADDSDILSVEGPGEYATSSTEVTWKITDYPA